MIIEQLKDSGIEVFPDEGENAYKVILDHPIWCTQCGMKVVGVGFSKPRTFIEIHNGSPRPVTLRCSRYRCSNKKCNAYAYTGKENPVSLFIDVGEKISLEVKLSAIRAKLSNPGEATGKICEKYCISRSTFQKELRFLYDRVEVEKAKWIDSCDFLVFWPIIYKGRTKGCLFGVDNCHREIGLIDIIPDSEIENFFCNRVYKNNSNVVLKIDFRLFWKFKSQKDPSSMVITEEDYDEFREEIAKNLLPEDMERLDVLKEHGVSDQTKLTFLLRELSEEKGVDIFGIDNCAYYARWVRNTVEFDRSYVENVMETMKMMWDNHLSDREILLHFIFTGTLLKEQFKQTGFGCYIPE